MASSQEILSALTRLRGAQDHPKDSLPANERMAVGRRSKRLPAPKTRKERADAKFKVLERIIVQGQYHPDLNAWERIVINRARPEIILRNLCAPLKSLPASYTLWGRFYVCTVKVPLSIFSWKKHIGPKTIKNLLNGIRGIFYDVFSRNGMLEISLYIYPHWYPHFHFHIVVGHQPFWSSHKKGGKALSQVNAWKKLSEDGKAAMLPEFFSAPPLNIDADARGELAKGYRNLLVDTFGKPALSGVSMDDLFWVSPGYRASEKASENMADYIRNKPAKILDNKSLYYDEAAGTVKVFFNARNTLCADKVRTYSLLDFLRTFIVLPSQSFYGMHFVGTGAYAGNSSFKPVLQFAHAHPEALPAISGSTSPLLIAEDDVAFEDEGFREVEDNF